MLYLCIFFLFWTLTNRYLKEISTLMMEGSGLSCLHLEPANDCSSEELFAPDCYDQNRRSDFQGCVEDNRYPYRAIYSAVMRLSIFIFTYILQ